MAGRKKTDADLRIAQRIHVLRRQRKISQENLAEVLGISFQQVQKYERGTNRISAGRLIELADALGVPVMVFYEGLSPKKRAEANASADIFNLTSETLQLALAFQRINDGSKRKQILALVRSVSDA